jgi:hypothetical protein
MKRINAVLNFDYDPETDTISNITVVSEGSISEIKKTRKSTKKVKDDSNLPMVTREENKLVLNSKLIELLGLVHEDRVGLAYKKIGKINYPVLGKAETFGDKASGNKLTKTNTVAFRGNNNIVLAEYGTTFDVELCDEGYVKLIPLDKPMKEDLTVQEAVKTISMEIITEDDTDYELEDEAFKFEL